MKKFLLFISICACLPFTIFAQQDKSKILSTMKKATAFMMDKVAYKGGFVSYYLPDLSRSWGEMEAKRTMAWVQDPGTPTIGHILLDAYHATGDEYYYEAAKKVANALIWGQLECGGWNYCFDFAGENSLKDWYETIGMNGWRLEEFQHYYGNATFDDGGTISAGELLLRMYIEKNDPAYKEPLEKVIKFVLQSQYPNGGWPQRYPLRYDHVKNGLSDYSSFLTLNDDVMPGNIKFLLECYQSLGIQGVKEPIYRAMYLARNLQYGAPYSGWSDQYTVDNLDPAHGRTYEPRSINTGTTIRMINAMIDYYKLTADTRFLSGIPAAINFLKLVKLPASEASKWERKTKDPNVYLAPRFVQPETGKPLYVHRMGTNVKNGRYYVNHEIANTIGHYSSAQYININAISKKYEDALKLDKEQLKKESPLLNTNLVPLDKYYTKIRNNKGVDNDEIKSIIKSLNKDGYWPTKLANISHKYKPYTANETQKNETKYARTLVGDEYDTSCYRTTEDIECISVAEYVQNMAKLIKSL